MESAKESFNINTVWFKLLLLCLIVVAVAYGLFYFGIIKKNCGQNSDCFYDAAKTCEPAKFITSKNGNYYEYIIKGERGDDCLMHVQLKKVVEGAPLEQKALFEGKEMECRVPLNELKQTSFSELNGFINHCHGSLKEAIYEQIITKMYGLIIQNMEDIIAAGSEG